MGRLEIEEQEAPLSPSRKRDLEVMKMLPRTELEPSDIPGLTDAECRDWKLLKPKRDRGQAMTPEELARYRDLKDKLKRLKDEEEEEKERLQTPMKGKGGPAKGILKTPDLAASENHLRPDRSMTHRSHNPSVDISDVSPSTNANGKNEH